MPSYAKEFWLWLKSLEISVEPLMLILSACNTARSIVAPQMAENKMMREYPAPPGLSDKELKKFYNKKMVIWDNNYSYVNLPIACIVGIMYGGYSDYYGRKVPLLIGIVSVLVENAMRILIWSPSTDISLYWFYPTAVITGLMGDFFLTMSCVNAYVADRFDDKKTLSTRMIIVSIMFSLGAFIASQSTKAILNGISSTALLVIVEGLLLVTLIAGILILSQSRPKKDLPSTEEPQEEREVESAGCLELTKLSFYSIYESLKIFVIPREGHRRLFLYLTFGANFLDQLSFGEEKSLIGTYTLLSPFNWTKDEYANYKSLRPIVQIVGMFFGLFVLKKWWKLRDTFVICMTIATLAISLFMIGLAEASWLIYASLAPGSLHGLLNPLTYTFMTCIVEQNEIGKAFAISSIAQKLAGFAQTAILQNIYIATLSWYQGFVWLVMGGICVVAVGLYGFVHVVAKREKIGS
uniref:Proton-coupled folate transporter n=1 Tax=Haemonchus contortus TaxID=6289 RepID=A0A7I5EED4_HAECO